MNSAKSIAKNMECFVMKVLHLEPDLTSEIPYYHEIEYLAGVQPSIKTGLEYGRESLIFRYGGKMV